MRGGGYIGLEFAGFFAALGVEVVVLEMLPRIASGCDRDVSSRLQQALKKSGVVFKTSHKVTAIEEGAVYCEDSTGVHALGDLSSEFIVAAAQMIKGEMCVEDVEDVVFPHPTVSEALKQAILELAAK